MVEAELNHLEVDKKRSSYSSAEAAALKKVYEDLREKFEQATKKLELDNLGENKQKYREEAKKVLDAFGRINM